MLKKAFLIISLFLSANTGYSQIIESQIISTAGNISNAGKQLSWTIGEPVIFTLSDNENRVLTQGFHQPTVVINAINDYAPEISVSVFPNPTSQIITIKLERINKNMEVEFYNSEGRLVLKEVMEHQIKVFDVSAFPGGLYYLYLKNQNQNLKTFKIIKE